jgi:2-polyprenyl-3-methyl-5-hydroxy-6-metoxy-1,4-benzoquinol methylase
MEKMYVNCNLCGSDDYEVLYPEGKSQIHRIVKCKNCDLMYANPQITHGEGGKVLIATPEVEVVTEKDLEDFTPENYQYLAKQYLQIKDYKNVVDFIDNRKRGVLMEVGAYAGNFCNEAKKRGWDIMGIEPLKLPVLYAKKNFDLDFVPTTFEECDLEPNSISAAVTFHVIEHIYNPREFILKIYNALEKNGILIFETPTYDSLSFKVLGYRERSMRCNGHIYFFTMKTLGDLMKSCGFRIVKHERVGRTLTFGRLLLNIGIVLGARDMFSKLTERFNLEKKHLTLNIGDMQRIYCEKI